MRLQVLMIRMEAQFPLFTVFIISLLVITTASNNVFNVVDYGAVGDGTTYDNNAFRKAWETTCASDATDPTMLVPSGKTFLVQPLRFEGRCSSHRVNVVIDGNLVAPSEPTDWKCKNNDCHQWIMFHKVDGLNVRGHGIIDAKGEKWWPMKIRYRPSAFEISNSDNVFLGGGLTFKDSPNMHVVLNSLESLHVSNVTIHAPGNSPNTDGIHVAGCTNSFIDDCRIGTGDDCISIVDGTSSLTVSNILCGPGHGISIGSLGKSGADDRVENIYVSDVVFTGATNGVRIKTWQGGRGYARNIVFERILTRGSSNPILIDQFYCDHTKCVTSDSAVQVQNVTYRQILGTSSKKKPGVVLKCSEAVPCKDIVLEDIYILSERDGKARSECSNVIGRSLGRLVPQLSCLN